MIKATYLIDFRRWILHGWYDNGSISESKNVVALGFSELSQWQPPTWLSRVVLEGRWQGTGKQFGGVTLANLQVANSLTCFRFFQANFPVWNASFADLTFISSIGVCRRAHSLISTVTQSGWEPRESTAHPTEVWSIGPATCAENNGHLSLCRRGMGCFVWRGVSVTAGGGTGVNRSLYSIVLSTGRCVRKLCFAFALFGRGAAFSVARGTWMSVEWRWRSLKIAKIFRGGSFQ